MENKYASLKKSLVIFLILVFLIIAIFPKEMIRQPSIIGNVLAMLRIISGIAPTFDFNLTNYTIYQNDTFFLDVNCTDIELLDIVYYFDNFTGFEINISTGIINKSGFNDTVVGNNTIKIICSDGTVNNSQNFVLQIIDINNPPVLNSIGPQIAEEGELFTLQVTATDPENDNLTFNASTSLFTINPATGLVNFTPSLSQVGTYTINISVFDGQYHDWEIVSFTITMAPYCGDDSCGSGERCGNCPEDCGECPEPPPQEEEEQPQTSGGGGGNPGPSENTQQLGPSPAPFYRCDEKWECSDWSTCTLEGTRARKCKDTNKCNTEAKKPLDGGVCEYVPTCFDLIENGDEDSVDCGGPCEPCLVANCFDSIQNQNETGIDCGGSCKICEIKQSTSVPFIELPAVFNLPKKFPWLLAIIIAIIVVSSIIYDQMRMRKIRKKKFAEYRESIVKYRPFRKKLYKFAVNLPIVTLIICSHIYYFSNNFKEMMIFSFIPIVLMIGIPLSVMYFYSKFSYDEYKKKTKEEMLKLTHKRELLQLILVENKMLVGMELKVKNQIFNLATHHKFDEFPALYREINPVYSTISSIEKTRREKVMLSRISSEVFQKIMDLIEDKLLVKVGKDYPEFMSIKDAMLEIKENINQDTSDYESVFMHDMKLVSMPQILVVIQSKPSLIELYNELVDVYNHFVEKSLASDAKDEEIVKIERLFSDKFKEIGKQSALLDIIAKNTEYANVYNTLMDLFNHYMRKAELSGKVKGL